jgi:hypothetical protein
MSQVSSEFIFFKVKCDVEPEDPGSDMGVGLMRVFLATKQQSGHHSSAWGRAVEDPNMIVWVIGALRIIFVQFGIYCLLNYESIRLD